MSGAIQFGRAVITLGIDDKTQADMRKWASQAKAFAVASAAIAGAAAALKSFASQGAAIQDIADRTGLAASQVSALGYAARQSGTDIGAMQTGISKMSRLFTDASEESKSAVAELEKLGLTAAQLQTMGVNDRFLAIADAISKVDDPSVRAAYVMEIFGRSSQALIPLLSQGREGITQLTEEAKRLGLVWSDDMAAAAAKLDDQLVRLNDQWMMMVANTGRIVADTGVVDWLSSISAEAANATQELRQFWDVLMRAAKRGQLGGGPIAATMALSQAGNAKAAAKQAMQEPPANPDLPPWAQRAMTAGDLSIGRGAQQQAEADAEWQRLLDRTTVTVERVAQAVEEIINVRQATEAPGALDARSIEAYKQAFSNQFATSDKQLEVQRRILQQLQRAPIVLGEA